MKKRVISLFLALAMFLSLTPVIVKAESAADLSMSLSKTKVTVGETVEVNVRLNKPIPSVRGAEIRLQYDTDLFEVVGSTVPSKYNGIYQTGGNVDRKVVIFLAANQTGELFDMEEDVFTVQFKAKAAGDANFQFISAETLFYDAELEEISVGSAATASVTLEAASEDTEDKAAKEVEDLIDAIGTLTPENMEAISEKIAEARTAYENLTETQQALVTNYQKLLDAEAAFWALVGDITAAEEVEDLIDEIGTVTPESEVAIKAARDAYDALSDAQKALVTNYQMLTDAESAFNALKSDVQKVIDLIDVIGTFSADDEAAVQRAKAAADAYYALTDEEKAQVTNVSKLMSAIDAYNASSLPQLTSFWPSFRKDSDNTAVVDKQLPRNSSETGEKWIKQIGSSWIGTGSPIIVGDYIYITAGSNLLKIDKNTGQTVRQQAMAAGVGFFAFAAYGDGMIFVPLNGGILQAFNADTLEPLWQTASLGYQPLSSAIYYNGCVYMGVSNGGGTAGAFFCVSARDENPWKTNEVKAFTWIDRDSSCYWAGATLVGDAVIYGNDAGVLQSRNRLTGEVLDSIACDGNIRGSITYDKDSGSVYWTTKTGQNVYKVKVNSDGTFDDATLKNGKVTSASTVTPLVYNGRVYVPSGSFDGGGGMNGMSVFDADTMERLYYIDLGGMCQSSPLLTTAYATEENNHTVYLYVCLNTSSGQVKVIKDFEGNMTPIVETLYTPSRTNYCTHSLICDDDGRLYYKNDSGFLFALKSKTDVDDEKAAKEVEDLIDEIGTLTPENMEAISEKIAEARTAYENLTETQQALVTNYQKLLDAEAAFWALVGDITAAEEVEDLINEIGTVTLESEVAIKAARDAYDALSDAQKALVTNYQMLTDAEAKYKELSDKQAADKAAAEAVMELIDRIGIVTLESSEAITNARDAHDALTDDQKALVTNYQALIDAEVAHEALIAAVEKELADRVAAEAVMELIDRIGTVTLESSEAIANARVEYDRLTADQKALVSNYETLTNAEAAYQKLLEDKTAAGAVIDLIDGIGTVTLDSSSAIANARVEYDKLTADQKALITNYKTLTDAETAYQALIAAAEKEAADKAAAKLVDDKIEAIGTVTLDSGEALENVRKAYDALTADQKQYVTKFGVLEAAQQAFLTLYTGIDAFEAKVNALPADVSQDDFKDLFDAEVLYDALSTEEKAHIDSAALNKFNSAKANAAEINHTSNGITISGVDWKVILVAVPVPNGADYDAMQSFAGDKSVLAMYDITLKTVTEDGIRDYYPDGSVLITITANSIKGYGNIMVLHNMGENEYEWITPVKVDGNKVSFESDSFSGFAVTGTKTSPQTGDRATFGALALLSVSAAAVYVLRRKKNGLLS